MAQEDTRRISHHAPWRCVEWTYTPTASPSEASSDGESGPHEERPAAVRGRLVERDDGSHEEAVGCLVVIADSSLHDPGALEVVDLSAATEECCPCGKV